MKNKAKSEATETAPTASRAKKNVAKLEKPDKKSKATGEIAATAKVETKVRSTKTAERLKTGKTAAETPTKAAKSAPKAESAVDIATKIAKAHAKTEESTPRTKKDAIRPAGTKRRKSEAKHTSEIAAYNIGGAVVDPIGDTTDGEGQTYLGESEADAQASAEAEEFRKDTKIAASDAILEAGPGMEAAAEAAESGARKEAKEAAADDDGNGLDEEAEPEHEDHGPAKLERLQKILSQAGIASRRRAEEMITEGRVMVNGQVVSTLGSKADPARDHIRVDGKLLHGAERHRYFLLNKPRGYVTTVSDPEGRPTVMDFVAKAHERLYPVGRLDYQSEGLLLMTNDGELANLLSKAGSGVEKTYLVKVAGQPSEQDLEKLRGGVTIERAEEGSGRVRTAPARVRQVRVGDNPWFEVVLIEGRNRELRKMFAAVGHFVEKIRRVSYGPLMLDVEPGKLRELTPDEVTALRLTAEGKMKPRRANADRMLPADAGRSAEKRDGRGGAFRSDRKQFGGRRSIPGPKGGTRDTQRSGDFRQRDRGEFGKREDSGIDRGRSGGFDKRERRDFVKRDSGEFRRSEQGGFGRREGGGFAGRARKPFPPREDGSRDRERRPQRGEFGGQREGATHGEFGDRREGRTFGGGKPPFNKPRFEQPGFGGAPRRERESGGDGERKNFGDRSERKPFRERGARKFGAGGGKPFRPHGERPYFKQGGEPKGRFDGAPAQRFEKGGGQRWGAKPEFRRDEGPRGEARKPREGTPEFRGQGRKFGARGAKPAFRGKPGGFSGPRREGGGGGRFRGAGGRGSGRPSGGNFGGRKRG